MMARFLRDDIQYKGPPELKSDDTREVEILRNGAMVKLRFWNKGAVVNHPQAFRLVQMGTCEPADDECKERANMNPEQSTKAAQAYERLSVGITVEDAEKFDRGEIVGYNPDGSYKPGPNAVTFDDEDEGDDDDEDE